MGLLVEALVVIAASVVVALGAYALLRRFVPPDEVSRAQNVVPLILGIIGGFFGLVGGFMLSTSWVELRGLRNAMTAEVNALADMADIASMLPEAPANELKLAIHAYLESVVASELPAMARLRKSPTTTRALTDLWRPLAGYRPESQREVSLQAIAINKVMDLGERRRQRIVFSRERLPSLLWWVLLSSGVFVVAGACMVSLRQGRPAVVVLAALTALVTLVLFSIRVLERPFQYHLATESSEYGALWELVGGAQSPTR